MLRPSLTLLAALALALGGRPADAQTAAPDPLVPVAQATPNPVLLRRAHLLGRQAPDAPVSLSLALPLRNQDALHALLHRLYDRSDPAYGHYLTGAQFNAQFAPAAADDQAVADFARARGLSAQVSSGGTLVSVSGTSGAVEAALGVQLNRYQMPDGRVAYANTAAPQVPASVAARLGGLFGLDTLVKPRTHLKSRLKTLSAAQVLADAGSLGLGTRAFGSGPAGGLSPSDIKAVYNLSSVGLAGEGQSLGLLELDGYVQSDITRYNTQFGLGANVGSVLSNIYVDGYSGAAGAGQGEVVLDIDLMLAVAPKVPRIYVYEAADTAAEFLAIENKIADDDLTPSVSCSWGIAETDLESGSTASQYGGYFDAENAAFQKMAAQGQSFYDAAGDAGAYDDFKTLSVDNPGAQPYVTAVGGTTLSVTGGGTAQIAYQAETTWGTPSDTRQSPFGAGGGGGTSIYFPKPSYQYTNSTANPPTGPLGASATMRDLPDVSLDADPNSGYDIFVGADSATSFQVIAGTSAAAPLWAAFTALVNEARAVGGTSVPAGVTPTAPASPLGFANPIVYEIGTGQYGTYANDFHDITTGNNLHFSAVAGFDDATGWGTFNGLNLLLDLAAVNGTTFSNPLAHTFAPGLQMISAPFDYSSSGMSFGTIFNLSPVASNEDLIIYQPLRSAYVFYPTAPADTLRSGVGYWLNVPAGADGKGTPLARVGSLVKAPLSVSLQPGWNQIGDPFVSAEPFTHVVVSRAGGTTTGTLDAAKLLVSPVLYTYPAGATQYATETSQLQPFLGYWVYAHAPVTLTFNSPSP